MEFRAGWTIRIAVLMALVVWTFVAIVGVLGGELPLSERATALVFAIFFFGCSTYYWCMTYVVDEYGLTYHGATAFQHVPWEDIIHLEHSNLPFGGWIVATRRGGLILSNFIHRQDTLRAVIVARAGLFAK
ncbi:MAG: hypothetical protein ACFB9M_06800 [Myxococcota bacterium]